MAEDNLQEEYCNNCKKNIASINFVMHEMHCKRHIILCKKCNEPVPRSEEEEHFETVHAKVECDLCKQKIEKNQLEHHKKTECQSKPKICSYCELQMPQCDLPDHENYCGTRTEPCSSCKQFIMIKDFTRHLDSNCQYPAPKTPPPAPEAAIPISNFYGMFSGRDPYDFENMDRLLDEASVPSFLQLGSNNHFSVTTGNLGSRHTFRNNTTDRQRKNTTNSKSEVNRHNDVPAVPQNTEYGRMSSQLTSASGESDEDISHYVEAIRKSNSHEGPDSSDVNQFSDDFEVPCEFCGETFPSFDIIQHQSGCEISMADEEWTKSPSPPQEVGERNNEVQPEVHRTTAYVPVINNLHDSERWHSPDRWQEENRFVNEVSCDDEPEVDVELPCEFCTELFPSNMLVIHQSICDANTTITPRMVTPVSTYKPKLEKNSFRSTNYVTHDNFNQRRTNRHQRAPPGFESVLNNNELSNSDRQTSYFNDFDETNATGHSRLNSNGNKRTTPSSHTPKRHSSKAKETLDSLLNDDQEILVGETKRNFDFKNSNTGASGGAGNNGEERKKKVVVSAKKVYNEMERQNAKPSKSRTSNTQSHEQSDSIGASSVSRQRSTHLLNADSRSGATQPKSKSSKSKPPSRR